MTGPAEISPQCSRNTSVMRRSTVSPFTGTSAYSVTLPSTSRTTPSGSAMARIVSRIGRWPSLQLEHDRQHDSERPRRAILSRWQAAEALDCFDRSVVEYAMGGRRHHHDARDRAGRLDFHLDLYGAGETSEAGRRRISQRFVNAAAQ